jgi:hypothetical protein
MQVTSLSAGLQPMTRVTEEDARTPREPWTFTEIERLRTSHRLPTRRYRCCVNAK